jgi:hypothetical protein
VKKGDHPDAPLELIIRRVDDGREFREETIVRIGHSDPVDPKLIEKQVAEALGKLLKTPDVTKGKKTLASKSRTLKKK